MQKLGDGHASVCVEVSLKKKFFFGHFYLFLRQTWSVSGGGAESDRETQNWKQAPGSELSAESLRWGSKPPTVMRS